MSIQGNINQLLTMAGTAAMLSPEFRQKAEDRATRAKYEKQMSSAEKQQKHLEKKLEDMPGFSKDIIEQMKEGPEKDAAKRAAELFKKTTRGELERVQETQYDIAKQQYDLDPSKENLTNLLKKEGPLAVRKQRAMEHMQEVGQNQAEQKADFDKLRDSLNNNNPIGGK